MGALIELLFEAPSDPRCWNRMLKGLCREISKDAVAIVAGQFTPDSPAFLIGSGPDVKRVTLDLFQPLIEPPSSDEMPVGVVFPIAPANAALGASYIFQNVLRAEGVAPGPGYCLVLGRSSTKITGALLVLSRDASWTPREDDRVLLELLAPYLRQAIQIGMHLNERRSDIEALLGIFDALALGVVLLDTKREVTFANRAAADLLGTSAGLSRPGRAGATERKRRTTALSGLLRRESSDREAWFAHPPPAEGGRLHIISTPVRIGGTDEIEDARFAAAVFLADLSAGAASTKGTLGALYGLTPAEERLALRLASGETLEGAAGELGIRPSTARGTLRSVFKKTAVRRQPELVRLVLTLVGRVRLDETP